jgi:hypothetical protein
MVWIEVSCAIRFKYLIERNAGVQCGWDLNQLAAKDLSKTALLLSAVEAGEDSSG